MKALNRIAIGFSAILVLPFLFMKGMFMDGAMYAAVSLNMSEGIGSFWQPYYGQDFFGLDGFYENPPLGLYNVSLFFKIFGSSFWVERAFIAICFALSIIGLRLNLGRLDHSYNRSFWYSLIVWTLMPTMFWTFRYNMMEVQLIPILLFGHWWFLGSKDRKSSWLIGPVVFAFFNLAAFLIKGPVGVFLLVAPFLYALIIEKRRKYFIYGFISGGISLVLGFSLLIFEGAHHFFDQYLFVRTAERLANNPTVTSRFWIMGELFQQLALPVVVSLLLVFSIRKKYASTPAAHNVKYFWYLLAVAISGSLPLMVSLVQRPFYLSTSFPFYAMAIGVVLLPYLRFIQEGLKQRVKKALNLLSYLIIGALLIMLIVNWGAYKRDEVLLKDIQACVEELPSGQSRIYVSDQVIFNWSLKAYMMRYERVDLLSYHGFDPKKSVYLLSQDYIPKPEHGTFKLLKSYQYFKLYRLEQPKL